MAQYPPESAGEDLFDVGNPIDNFNYTNLNNEDPSDDSNEVAKSIVIPITKEESSSKRTTQVKTKVAPPKPSMSDIADDQPLTEKQIPIVLIEICEEFGLLMSKQMENSVIRSWKTRLVTRESLRWFVQGYTVCITSHLVSSMQENMNDFRTEIKKMQMSTSSMGSKSDRIVKAADTLEQRINEASGEIAERFHSTLENVEKFVSDKIKVMSEIVETTIEDKVLASNTKETIIVPPAIKKGDLNVREVPKQDTVIPVRVEPHQDIGTAASVTNASSSSASTDRKAIMKSAGFSPQFIKNIPEDALIRIIPPSLISDIKSMTLTPRVQAALKGVIMNNISDMNKKPA
ncbi:MAG: putative phosphoprotein [Hainan cytorhabdovirus]|nr:MAG: putative phosphoprotein [Hainan cytorhabdovirus]